MTKGFVTVNGRLYTVYLTAGVPRDVDRHAVGCDGGSCNDVHAVQDGSQEFATVVTAWTSAIGRGRAGLASVQEQPEPRRDRDRVLKAVKFMEQHGGGFCSALAKCWFKADSTNQLLLEGTFAHYFERFQRDVEELERQKVAGDRP